jgi:cell division protein FtsN
MEYDSRHKQKNLFAALMELGVLSILRSPIVSTLLLFLAGALFAAVIMLSYPDSEPGVERLPVIKADNAPYKTVPDERGGMDIPGRESTVFQAMRGEGHQTGVENLLAQIPAEEPLMDISEAVGTADFQEKTTQDSKTENIAEETPEKKEPAVIDNKPKTKPTPKLVKKTKTEDKASETVEYVRSVLKDKTSKTAAGGYYVQLASLKSETDAEKQWKALQKKYSVLAGASHRIKRVDLGAKGVYYRLQVGGMDKSKADALCKAIRAKSGGCFVVK